MTRIDGPTAKILSVLHRRWYDELTRRGWTRGPYSEVGKHHPLLYPHWGLLPENEKQMDGNLADFARDFIRMLRTPPGVTADQVGENAAVMLYAQLIELRRWSPEDLPGGSRQAVIEGRM